MKPSTDRKILEGVALISSMSLAQLQELQTTLSVEINKRQIENKREALTQIRNIAAANGLNLAEIAKEQAPKFSKPKTSGGPREIKYRHPENPSLEWSGFGRKPDWFKAWLDANGSEDGLKVA